MARGRPSERGREAFELYAADKAQKRAEALDDIRFAPLAERPPEVRLRRELDARAFVSINWQPVIFLRAGNQEIR
jgi:hypothetical protein